MIVICDGASAPSRFDSTSSKGVPGEVKSLNRNWYLGSSNLTPSALEFESLPYHGPASLTAFAPCTISLSRPLIRFRKSAKEKNTGVSTLIDVSSQSDGLPGRSSQLPDYALEESRLVCGRGFTRNKKGLQFFGIEAPVRNPQGTGRDMPYLPAQALESFGKRASILVVKVEKHDPRMSDRPIAACRRDATVQDLPAPDVPTPLCAGRTSCRSGLAPCPRPAGSVHQFQASVR